MSEWCTIESDPGVFTELIREIGVKHIAVEEIYSLDDEMLLENLKPIYGLIFLFKWTKKLEERECLKAYDSDLFFARQVITNACATQAILAVLLNNQHIEIGDELGRLKETSLDWDPQMKGLAISNCELIRKVHNSFAKPEPFIYTKEKRAAGEKDDVYHFISYIPFKNKVYELDGLQPGPILLGSFEKEDQWIDIAREEINKRILKYSETEIRFTLLSIGQCKKHASEVQIQKLQSNKLALFNKYLTKGGKLDGMMESDYQSVKDIKLIEEELNVVLPEELKDIEDKIIELNSEIKKYTLVLDEEIYKAKRYEVENVRRRHNYIPFICEFLKLAAKKGKLEELVTDAKKRQQEKKEKQKEKEKEKELEKEKEKEIEKEQNK